MNAKKKYVAEGPDYDLACKALGWDPACRAVRVRRMGSVLYVQGTALKPEEWRSLEAASGRETDDTDTVMVVLARTANSVSQGEQQALYAARQRNPRSTILWPDGAPPSMIRESLIREIEAAEDAVAADDPVLVALRAELRRITPPTYSVMVLEPSWRHLHDGSPVVIRRCGHEHKSIAAAERCRRHLTKGDFEGWVNSAWRDAEVRRSDGSRLSDEEGAELLKLEGSR